MATRRLGRKSTGQEVTLLLGPISKDREQVAIDFPGTEIAPSERQQVGYNVRLVFARKDDGRNPWVEVVERQAIDAIQPAVTHISQSVFWGMAVWACTILHASRVVDLNGDLVIVPPAKILWDVYWVADDGHHYQGSAWATRASYACDKVAWLGVMRDNMYAVPTRGSRQITR